MACWSGCVRCRRQEGEGWGGQSLGLLAVCVRLVCTPTTAFTSASRGPRAWAPSTAPHEPTLLCRTLLTPHVQSRRGIGELLARLGTKPEPSNPEALSFWVVSPLCHAATLREQCNLVNAAHLGRGALKCDSTPRLGACHMQAVPRREATFSSCPLLLHSPAGQPGLLLPGG